MRLRWIILALLLVGAATARAQQQENTLDTSRTDPFSRWYFGVTGSLSANKHAGGFPIRRGEALPDFNDGRGVGGQVGLAAAHMLSDKTALDIRATYDQRDAAFQQPYPGKYLLIPGTGTSLADSIAYADIAYRLLTLEVLASHRFMQMFRNVHAGLSIGPTVSFVTLARSTRYDEYRFNSRRTLYRDRDIDSASLARLSIKFGSNLDAQLSSRHWLHIRMHIDVGLTTITRADFWRIHTVQLEVGFLTAI